MKRLFACVSTRTRLAIMVIGLSFLCSIIYSMPASAAEFNLSYIGPASSNDRYNLTSHPKHPRVSLRIPVYFKYNPGTTGVTVKDVYRGKDPGNGARFNGYYYMSGDSDGHFDISGFHYESSTGLWRADVTARLTNNGQLAKENSGGAIYQFRLELDDHNGIIAYAKGWASQANKDYRVEYNGTYNGGFDEEELRMSLPCDITQDVELGPNQPNQLILFDLDQPRWDHPGTNRGKDIYVTIFDETDGTVARHYHGPDHDCGEDDYQYHGPECMGENGTLSVRMTMKPGHKYRIKVWPNWVNNLIEYHLPFDNISYATECEPKIDMRTTVDFTKRTNKGRFKQLSSYGKYNSNEGKGNGNNSIAEVMGYPGKYHFKKWEGISPQDSGSLPKAIMDSDKLQGHGGELYPGDVLTWWFRAYNSGGYIVPDAMKMDFANLREGWIDPRLPGESWNQPEPKPEKGSNWFQPADRGGPLNGSDHRQVMWGCYNWDDKCMDYGFNNSGFRFNSNYPDEGVFVTKQEEAIDKHYRYIVKSGDAGQTLCQWLRMSWNYNGWKQRLTPKACVYIPYHYPGCPEGDPSCTPNNCTMRGDCPGGTPVKRGVKPSVSAQPATVEAGGMATFTYNLNNAGPTKSKDLHYQAYTFILRSGANLPDNKAQAVAYPMSWGAVGCGGRHVGWGSYRDGKCSGGISGNTVVYPGEDVHMTRQYRVADLGAERWLAQPGDKICSYLALDQRWNVYNDVDSRTFVASNIACVTITKKPSLQLIGSDSYAQYGFTGSDVRENMVSGTDKRGSYSQYGLLTGDKNGVTNFGSARYTTASPANHYLACKLSYANTGSVKNDCKNLNGLQPAGLSKKSLSTPSSTNTTPLPGGSNVDLSNLPSGNYNYTGSVPLNISGNLDKKGKHITIFAEKTDVTITGKIDAYAGPYANLSDIPSFTIKAKTIKVNPGVSLITGTYVAKDHFESCNGAQEKGPTLGVEGVCKNKLKVNGAIVSDNSPIFRRTFGAGNQPDDYQWETNNISSTAEWINYTPNLWLTTSNGSSGNQLEGLTTTQVTNLPVRY